ncbi:MAG: signal transduction histidine kinase [Candidatus Latescibacterota bacterium]|jgi:signal transduction histidine kinase
MKNTMAQETEKTTRWWNTDTLWDRRVPFRRSILFRTARLSGLVSMITIALFAVFLIPYQEKLLIARLASTSEVIATSIDQVAVSSIVVEDYSAVIEHCQKVVAERPSVAYLVITRKDGFSLINIASGWQHQSLDQQWTNPKTILDDPANQFQYSDLVNKEVFHYAYRLEYSGIDWGWIHVGLATEEFHTDLNEIYSRTLFLAAFCILFGAVVSIIFSRSLVQPVLELNRIAQRVGQGQLNARAQISSGDEVETLANDFNTMTDELQKSYTELETRVQERTTELRQSNDQLHAEILERIQAETARKEAEAELATQRTHAMRSDRLRSLGEMAAGMAHELNQPLVGVRGLAEHILIGQQQNWELTPEKLKERMTVIIEQADRMVHIIQHVRLFAREADKQQKEPVNLNDVVKSSIDLIGAQLRSRGIVLETKLTENLPLVMVNPFSIEQVLLNLLNNARDAVEEFYGKTKNEDHLKVFILTRISDQNKVEIQVIDNGGGIPQDIMQKVFDPFFTTKDPDKGTGLGLSISKSIIEEFSGSLNLESNDQNQTIASIHLPAQSENS